MFFQRKKRIKIVALSLSGAILASVALGSILFSYNQKNLNGFKYNNHFGEKSDIFHKGNPDTEKAINSITDRNLKEIKKPIIIKPKPEPKIEIEPILIPHNPKTIEKEKKLIEKKPDVQNNQTSNTIKTTITLFGKKIEAEVTPPPTRELDKRDIEAKITNVKPYIRHIVGDIKNIKVTEELKNALVNNLVNKEAHGLKNFYSSFRADLLKEKTHDFDPEKHIQNNFDAWQKIVQKFQKLLDSNNVIKFLLPDAAAIYPTKQFTSQNLKYAWLISNLDYSKFNKLSKGALQQLKQGFTATAEESYINENGELDSYTYEPAPGYNKVTTSQERENKKRRAIPIKGYYGRTPDQISNGEYPGWKKENVTQSQEFKEFGIKTTDGINITRLTNQNPEEGELKKATIVEIDAANFQGYEKTKKLIENLTAKGIEITSYRIKNMGKKDVNQKFKEILSALPQKLGQLELFFDHRATNTASLIALENKNIKEVGLYTLGNSLLDDWSINPLALRNVEWVNTIDYNVSKENKPGSDIATRITFNTLAFEESDILKNESDIYKRINEGLRMAYYTRNNEGIFEGNFGPGLHPDNNEGNNSYPTRLDFSRAPSIRSLKGLKFYDYIKPSNKPRKLKNLKLFNDKNYFEISGDELDKSQFEDVMAINEPPFSQPPTKIEFSNGSDTDTIRITGVSSLTNKALSNLSVLRNLSKISSPIQISPEAKELRQQLINNGYEVTDINDETFN
ncbi:putative immunoglobulin-blocking virulence protein [Metamycoplasma canadense]|nr:putative immunoglobulin-blocking virulence protein [Metamycoplasma canadense]